MDFLLQRVLKSFLRIFVSLCFCCLYYRRTVSFCQYIFLKIFILFFCCLLIVLLYRIILIICFSMPSAPEPYSIQKGCWKGGDLASPFQQPPYLIHGPYASSSQPRIIYDYFRQAQSERSHGNHRLHSRCRSTVARRQGFPGRRHPLNID